MVLAAEGVGCEPVWEGPGSQNHRALLAQTTLSLFCCCCCVVLLSSLLFCCFHHTCVNSSHERFCRGGRGERDDGNTDAARRSQASTHVCRESLPPACCAKGIHAVQVVLPREPGSVRSSSRSHLVLLLWSTTMAGREYQAASMYAGRKWDGGGGQVSLLVQGPQRV